MSKAFSYKKLMLIVLPVLALAFIAGVPLNDNKTVLEQIIAAFPSGEADEKQQEKAKDSLDDVWQEIQKLASANSQDSISMSGTIRLYDNLFESGIKEQQSFSVRQSGVNQWFHLDSFDRVQLGQTFFMIDHPEMEITIQLPTGNDSLVKALQMMSPEKLKKLLIKDGTTAELSKEASFKMLTISPGTMDAVNRYDIVYDSTSYEIKKFRIYYTNTPYQEYKESDSDNKSPGKQEKLNQEELENKDTEEDDIEMNVTEYVLEFEIHESQRKCDLDFKQNQFYRISSEGDVIFTGKLEKYKKTSF